MGIKNKEPKVIIHYSYGVGTDIATVPVSEITSYANKFAILSVTPEK
jgi:hypothetical protein